MPVLEDVSAMNRGNRMGFMCSLTIDVVFSMMTFVKELTTLSLKLSPCPKKRVSNLDS